MATTPRPVIDPVLRSVCGREVERLVRLTGGGLHEAYRVDVRDEEPLVIRIARPAIGARPLAGRARCELPQSDLDRLIMDGG
jgi:hypothetical protein